MKPSERIAEIRKELKTSSKFCWQDSEAITTAAIIQFLDEVEASASFYDEMDKKCARCGKVSKDVELVTQETVEYIPLCKDGCVAPES